jgi:hypothetical protein
MRKLHSLARGISRRSNHLECLPYSAAAVQSINDQCTARPSSSVVSGTRSCSKQTPDSKHVEFDSWSMLIYRRRGESYRTDYDQQGESAATDHCSAITLRPWPARSVTILPITTKRLSASRKRPKRKQAWLPTTSLCWQGLLLKHGHSGSLAHASLQLLSNYCGV